MNEFDAIRDAVAAFTASGRPVGFYDSVWSMLDADAQRVFVLLWERATRSELWMSSDLAACTRAAASSLKGEFGHLDMGTIKAIANAAAFEWR